jgi:hypothetical protein
MMNTAMAFDEHHPRARIGLKRIKLVQIERIPNLTSYWLSVRHGCPLPFDLGMSTWRSASRQ